MAIKNLKKPLKQKKQKKNFLKLKKQNRNKRTEEIKKISRKELKRKILKITNGVLSTLTDLILFEAFYLMEFGGSTSHRQARGAAWRANNSLYDFNFETIRSTFYRLKRKGLFKSLNLALKEEVVSNAGRRRLKETVPCYYSKRTWDKRLYLITYDIPEKERGQRDKLRQFLKQLKCALLQKSVWLTVYNPKTLIKEFIKEQGIDGQILISDLGPDGNIGNDNLKSFVAKIYRLDKINNKYEDFCYQAKQATSLDFKQKRKLVFYYLSILKKDPQLPFDLLPLDWQGNKAFLIYKNLIKK